MLEELIRPLRVSADLQHEIEQFLYLEAALLDERRLREWLDLLAEDVEYTLDTNSLAQFRSSPGWAPPTTYIFHEDKYQLERRVARVETGQAWAEEPASRTRHFVTNVRILAQSDDELVVGCNYLVHRASKARSSQLHRHPARHAPRSHPRWRRNLPDRPPSPRTRRVHADVGERVDHPLIIRASS
jgi:3-phenylpropionate/trans-cinnamate dioxygenase beta subunit